MAIVTDYLTNHAYGFPARGGTRRIDPSVLAVVHVTGNSKNLGADAAMNERNYANRPASPGPSAHYYIGRDGSGVHAIDELHFAAWSNGDLKSPNLDLAGVRYLVNLRAKGHNANEGCYLEIEGVGAATVAGQWTEAQFATVATLIRNAAKITGLPINRQTVLTHADINSVDRANCAFLARTRESQMKRLIELAKGDDLVPIPITDETPREITVSTHAAWYDLDGKTVLDTSAAFLTWRPSPYGCGAIVNGEATFRAMYATVAGVRRTVLVKSTSRRIPAQPAPIPDPTAFTRGFDAAKVAAEKAIAELKA